VARRGARRAAALVIAVVGIVALALWLPAPQRTAEACAFDPRIPAAYEADQQRALYRLAMDAASINALLPGDAFFALQPVQRGVRGSRTSGPPFIPAVLLKAIAWTESTMTMASRATPFNSIGDGLVTFDCGHGIMQVTTGMTVPLGAGGRASDRQVNIATHYAYNIARGAQILAEKWNSAPEARPIAGTDTASDPTFIENWYFAVWGYNGFTGPGANRSNHPMDPSFASWPRPQFRCDGTQSRDRYPYQELVWGCMAHPQSRDGIPLWTATQSALPDLTSPAFFAPLSLANWRFPYSAMDIPTPQPATRAVAPSLPGELQSLIFGQPSLASSTERVTIRLNDPSTPMRASITIRNQGSGILTWSATTSDNFLVLTPPAGVALGGGLPCNSSGCPNGTFTVAVNPTLLPAASATGTVTIASPGGGGTVTVIVTIVADFEVGAPGTSRAR
jgi:hypothetical protein